MKRINVNEIIKVKLNDYGKDIFYHRDDELNKVIVSYGGTPIEPRFPEVDKDGLAEFQLWDFMKLYGKYFTMGMNNFPLEDLNFYIDEKNLKDVEL